LKKESALGPFQALIQVRPGLGLNRLSSAGSGLEAQPGTSLKFGLLISVGAKP